MKVPGELTWHAAFTVRHAQVWNFGEDVSTINILIVCPVLHLTAQSAETASAAAAGASADKGQTPKGTVGR